jgi:mRNA interferase MazF
MISSQLHQQIPELDEIINVDDADFIESGLKQRSIIRICRLAAVNDFIFLGKIGQVTTERLNRIKQKLAAWINGLN